MNYELNQRLPFLLSLFELCFQPPMLLVERNILTAFWC